ncbi:hypothetical protein PM082_009808 [Marasmius tenuissimus]|nr:hypothetical protein PM082_009808 [Marasmius tenuissimus]
MALTNGVPEKLDILVVGAGFAGLYQLQLYRKLGYNLKVFEAGSDIGDWNWKEKYPGGEELRSYFRYVNDKLDLKDITFNTYKNKLARIGATKEAEQAWRDIHLGIQDKLLFKKARGWWNGGNIPGKTVEFLTFVGGLNVYLQT